MALPLPFHSAYLPSSLPSPTATHRPPPTAHLRNVTPVQASALQPPACPRCPLSCLQHRSEPVAVPGYQPPAHAALPHWPGAASAAASHWHAPVTDTRLRGRHPLSAVFRSAALTATSAVQSVPLASQSACGSPRRPCAHHEHSSVAAPAPPCAPPGNSLSHCNTPRCAGHILHPPSLQRASSVTRGLHPRARQMQGARGASRPDASCHGH
ncbi:hypothetical protein T440DRAFT_474577 [Plenodomus tracheiphilus IPT5]|uniref:Uncharacterized protein n=1 Tax=Plenodomus tracheiphilus IPT5 TaxID=1408161 RepID=A0A6A7BLB6_9PLEO|nr:hypothetical protein T440DRAFT_474577 [Plenodomus tracheiphilus IPT5]